MAFHISCCQTMACRSLLTHLQSLQKSMDLLYAYYEKSQISPSKWRSGTGCINSEDPSEEGEWPIHGSRSSPSHTLHVTRRKGPIWGLKQNFWISDTVKRDTNIADTCELLWFSENYFLNTCNFVQKSTVLAENVEIFPSCRLFNSFVF